jgi:hypothetical protein
LADGDITYYIVDPETGDVKLADGAPAGAMAAIASVEKNVRRLSRGGREIKVKVRFWSKPDALRMCGQYLKLFLESVHVNIDEMLAGELARLSGQGDDGLGRARADAGRCLQQLDVGAVPGQPIQPSLGLVGELADLMQFGQGQVERATP